MPDSTGFEIAIIGMAGRFPGAPDVETFWQNIRSGVESVTTFDRADLSARGVPDALLDAPDFVAAGAPVDGSDSFDAGFFGYSPAEAEILDPQQRIFLECAWHTLENAGYVPRAYPGAIGVYAATGMNGYLLNLYRNARIRGSVTPYEIFTSNDKDFLATRAAFKLGLRGPAVSVQTACSSSLVAVHMAAQSLIAGECDMALAGGVALSRQDGYRAMTGSILSASGHCRPFDAAADGTVAGNGVGLVLLKRLEDALADGDRIDAVIKGSAINNDGGGKASFTAPDVDAQAEVIAAAQAAAEVDPDSVSYVEAHGTGTALGDPIEVTALSRAFRRSTDRQGFCALGSVKSNIGHLDTAAGIAGLIKTVCMLRDGVLAPSLGYDSSNPKIDFAASPFTVQNRLADWTADGPRRAGVSSFGIGGTNAHVVLQQAPDAPATVADAVPVLLPVTAQSAEALRDTAQALASHLDATAPNLASVARTLATGRERFRWRGAVTATTPSEAAERLRALSPRDAADTAAPVFLFPGQGSQYPGMARALYDNLPAFAAWIDRATAHAGPGLRAALLEDDDAIHRTDTAQPALFAFEYALARVWMELGVTPARLIGHSLGELTAACLAGVFSFEDGLDLVARRGALMQAAPPGRMIAVVHGEADLRPHLAPETEIAGENGPGLTTVSGPPEAMEALADRLSAAGIAATPLRTSHGFHSAAMDAAAQQFAEAMARVTLSAPRIPLASNLSGELLTDAQATDPAYWGRQLRRTVRFGAAAAEALAMDTPVFVELGPGSALSNLLRHQGAETTVPGPSQGADGVEALMGAVGQAWATGLVPDLAALAPKAGRRIALPGYAFQRRRYWVDPDESPAETPTDTAGPARLYLPAWRRAALAPAAPRTRQPWLIFDDGTTGRALAEAIERAGDDAYRVEIGESFGESDYRAFTGTPGPSDWLADLFATLSERGQSPARIVFAWPLAQAETEALTDTLLTLAAQLSKAPRKVHLTLVTRAAADITGAEALRPDHAALHGMLQVAGQEQPWLGCRILDLNEAGQDAREASWLHAALLNDTAPFAARRGRHHWHLAHEALDLPPADQPLKRRGVFVVAGHVAAGLGRVWADRIAATRGARLALIEDQRAVPHDMAESDSILRLHADCTRAQDLGKALDTVTEHWGRIDGIFLSTPFSDPGVIAPLALLGHDQRAHARDTLTAPLDALAAALQARRVGFCCVQGSLSSQIGGVGLAAYAAAHARADLCVTARARDAETAWIALGCDALDDEPAEPDASRLSLTGDEVWDLTSRAIAARVTGHLVASRLDVDARRRQWLNPAPRDDEEKPATSDTSRPDLDTPFVAPRTALEAEVATILADMLGLESIGVEDGFFELGGHSLLAVRTLARLRETYPVEIEMRELLAGNPSAASIARIIETSLAGDADLASLVDEIAGLSEEDLEAALAEDV